MNNVLAGAIKRLPFIWSTCSQTSHTLLQHDVPRLSPLQVTRNFSLNLGSGITGRRTTCWHNSWRTALYGSHEPGQSNGRRAQNQSFHSVRPLNKSSPKSAPKRPKREQTRQTSLSSYDENSLRSIFGTKVPKHEGNIILRTIHERRVSGELADVGLKLDQHLATTVSSDAVMRALQWLRVNFPVDEQAAAERWVTQEEAKLGSEYEKSAERMGLYQSSENSTNQVEETSGPQPGESVIEHWIKSNKEKRVAERQRKVESGELQRTENLQIARMEARRSEMEKLREERDKRTAELHQQYYEKHSQKDVPNMSLLARLGPSTLFAAFVICSWVVYSEAYTPPLLSERLFPEIPAAAATVLAIMGVNLVIFCAWRVVKLWPLMNMVFTVVPAYPYALSILGNTFSHQEFTHIFANMLGLAIYGIPLHEDVGRGNFLALYMSGGVAGSLLSLYYYVLGQRWGYYSRGASGCVFAIMMAWAWITAQKPSKDTSTFAFAWDVALYASILIQFSMHFTRGVMQKMDVFAHVGGATVGLLGGFILTKFGSRSKLWAEKSSETRVADSEEKAKVNQERDQATKHQR